MTNIHNGDRFLYIEEADLDKVPDAFQVAEHTRIFKPKAKTRCKHCNQVGHHHLDQACATRPPDDLRGSVETFHGGKFPLSNLHKCPEGCVIKEGEPGCEKVFLMSKHHYRFHKLKEHGKTEEAFDLLEEENSFQGYAEGPTNFVISTRRM